MINIGIDGNEANVKRRVGIGQYAYEILRHLNKLKEKKEYIDIGFNIYLKENPLFDLPKEDSKWRYHVVRPSKLWTQFGLPIRLFTRLENSIFFTPSHYAPRFSNIPTVISIMDLSFLQYPYLFIKKDFYQLKNWTEYSARKAKKIFTISEFSKSEIIKWYQIGSSKIVVAFPGINTHLYNKKNISKQTEEEYKRRFLIDDEFVLFVGTIQPRKNIKSLIDAFEKVSKRHRSLQLLLVGKKGWMCEEILGYKPYLFEEKKVLYLDFASDEDLSILYNLAQMFVLPSFYEGFGIPVIEAMACGCPTIVSNSSSLPEISGGASLLIDPEKPEDIKIAIEKIHTDVKTREKLISAGLINAQKFNWGKSSEILLKNLIQLANVNI